MPAIETADLAKRFGSVVAVDSIDLSVPERSVYGFLGPNGAGKTTSIRLLLGLLNPTRGSVRLLGRDIAGERVAALAAVGAVVEIALPYDHLTGRENVEITRRVRGLPRSETDRVLALVGLAAVRGRRAGGYSQGMRQRLAIARALLGPPKLLLLDEPTNGLDPDGIHEIRNLVRSLPREIGATVFLSSHLLSEVEQVATHVGVMSKGRLVLQDALEHVLGGAGRTVEFEVDEPARAAEVIVAARPGAEIVRTPGGLRIGLSTEGESPREIAALNALLVGAGLAVYGIAPRTRSLEEVYMAHAGTRAREDGDDVPAAARGRDPQAA
jgi:ABC-2 type transport system ATP-binding protein